MLIDLLRAGEDTPELHAAISDALRTLWEARTDVPLSPPPVASSRNFPCPHQGELVQACASGSNCGRKWRDLYRCTLPASGAELCCWGVSRPALPPDDERVVASCSRCVHHPDAQAKLEEPAAGKVDGGGGIV